jgi:YVTN family beta-propeller protein
MRRWLVYSVVLCLALAACAKGVSNRVSYEQSKAAVADKAGPVPTAAALAKPGDAGDGSIIMVNGRAISPVGLMRNVLDYPSKILRLPNGNLAISALRSPGVTIIDGASFAEVDHFAVPATFVGLATNAAGDKLWVSGGGAQVVYEYDISTGSPALLQTIGSRLIPAGVAVTPDEAKLLVCDSWGSGVQIYDLATGVVTAVAPTNMYPYAIALSASGAEAYVSNWGGSSVTIIDVATAQRVAEVTVGSHPAGLALSPDGTRLYVANADGDSVSAINLTTRQKIAEYDIFNGAAMTATSPVDVAISSDGATLYVAAAGLNAVVVMNAADGTVKGMIPAGYYPSSIAVDSANAVLYVGNGKGGGIPGVAPPPGVDMSGTLQKIDIPNAAQLAEWTTAVNANLTRTALYWETMSFDSPIPTQRGVPSQQIKRVVFIMKENKTYDEVLGDMTGTEADPSLLEFGQAYTPNTHTLAAQFTNMDNYYSEANISLQGHMWAALMYSNDYEEKNWAMTFNRQPLSNAEPATRSRKGSLWETMLKNNVTFRVYGEVLTMGDFAEIAPEVDFLYGFWNQQVSDVTKADEILREWKAGVWPQLVYISLPNDHTLGSEAGQPTPQYYVGDNDAALGMLLDYITHSDHWAETAVFVIEDDPQSGADHVDPHRSICLVISPYAKHSYTSHVLYSMSSLWLTIEMILGLPSLTVYDDNTSPMYDAFTTTPDLATFAGVPNPTPLAYNAAGAPFGDYAAQQNWDVPDQVQRLGEMLWAIMKPGVPWPAQYSVDSYPANSHEYEEAEDAGAAYLANLRAAEHYALTHGLWDGARLPTIKELNAQ